MIERNEEVFFGILLSDGTPTLVPRSWTNEAEVENSVFQSADALGSAYKVVQYFSQNQIQFPKRDFRGIWAGEIQWGRLTHGRVLNVRHNPTYAGTYSKGKSTQQAHKKADKPNTGNTIRLPMSEWEVLIKDHHDAYISWEKYQKNQATLSANRTFLHNSSSPVREGSALLQGIAICGECGRKLGVRYTGNGGSYVSYECNYKRRTFGVNAPGISFSGRAIDPAISEIFLSALTEANLTISLAAKKKSKPNSG